MNQTQDLHLWLILETIRLFNKDVELVTYNCDANKTNNLSDLRDSFVNIVKHAPYKFNFLNKSRIDQNITNRSFIDRAHHQRCFREEEREVDKNTSTYIVATIFYLILIQKWKRRYYSINTDQLRLRELCILLPYCFANMWDVITSFHLEKNIQILFNKQLIKTVDHVNLMEKEKHPEVFPFIKVTKEGGTVCSLFRNYNDNLKYLKMLELFICTIGKNKEFQDTNTIINNHLEKEIGEVLTD